jgi:sugar lactone lactonase YvrE
VLRRYWRGFVLLAALALAGAAYYGARWPLRIKSDWEITQTIPLSQPDSLSLGADGQLQYVTLETVPGLLVELTPNGPKTVFGDFSKPDSLLVLPDTIIVTEEESEGRVMAFNRSTAKLRVLARLENPEGILLSADGSLVVALDSSAGRLIVLRNDAEPQVLVKGLDQPEGLCNLPDGRIGIAESGTGRILAHGPAGLEVLADDLDGIDQLACGADGSLWAVINQVRSGKLIRIQDGRRRTIARHLRQPQGIALAPDGSVYIAETRANRVLRLAPR